MVNIHKMIFVVASASVLLACGSGGSGSGATGTTGGTTISPPVSANTNYFTATGGNKEAALSFDSANIKTVIIGGEKLDISSYKAGLNQQWVLEAGGTSVGSNTHTGFNPQNIYAYTADSDFVVGMLMKDNVWYAFYNGSPTNATSMPVTGTASYIGGATFESGWGNGGSDYVHSLRQSGANISVDFGNKKLTGTISRDDKYGGIVNLNADITGNSFNSVGDSPVQTKGQFFGVNAEKLGGVFKDNSSVGAFYGSKQ